ncbi:MAG: LysR family transcriptional regulator [Hyphomonadaceae bacterium]
MKMEGVVTFVAVAETGSISEAARRLRLSKSVISERLSDLEHSLGANLIHRTTRKLSLTEDGLTFLDRARRIAGEAADAENELAERRNEMSGPLRINAPYSLTGTYLGRALHAFLLKHPEISLTLELDDRFVDPSSEGFDAVIRVAPAMDTQLETQLLGSSQRVLVASPDYIARNGAPASLADLERHRAVHFTDRSPDDWTFVTDDGPVVVRMAPNIRINGCEAVRDAAIGGLGLAYLPTFVCGDAVRSGALKIIHIGVRPDVNHIFAVYHNGRRPQAKLRELLDHVKRAFGDPPAWDRGLGL